VTAWDDAALDDLASYCQGQRTTGLLVVERRRTVLERNWPVPADSELFAQRFLHGKARDGALREDVASQQKSLVALLAAIAVDRGWLDLELPVSKYIGRGWSHAEAAQEDAIVVRHLLEMCSGLDDALRFEAPAGTHHCYNTPAYALLLPVLEAAADQSIGALTLVWLTGPAGMAESQKTAHAWSAPPAWRRSSVALRYIRTTAACGGSTAARTGSCRTVARATAAWCRPRRPMRCSRSARRIAC
jgi:CubicO group peptidase (beta-lactamase class C family)